jgi:hypothetical protein
MIIRACGFVARVRSSLPAPASVNDPLPSLKRTMSRGEAKSLATQIADAVSTDGMTEQNEGHGPVESLCPWIRMIKSPPATKK